VPVGQRLEPYRAEERLLGLHQQDGPGEARIVEAAAEVDARLDGGHLELSDREARPLQVERVHDLREVLDGQHDRPSAGGGAAPQRSAWSASTTGQAPRATASLASFTPCGMGCTVAVFSSASRRRHAQAATSSAALRASSGLPLVMAWTVMPTSGTSVKGKPK